MDSGALERILEHPEQLLEEATRTRRATFVQEGLLQTLQVLLLEFESLLEAIVVLQGHAPAQIIVTDAGISNLDRLGPSLIPVLGGLHHR